jgi:hypothetical protein
MKMFFKKNDVKEEVKEETFDLETVMSLMKKYKVSQFECNGIKLIKNIHDLDKKDVDLNKQKNDLEPMDVWLK